MQMILKHMKKCSVSFENRKKKSNYIIHAISNLFNGQNRKIHSVEDHRVIGIYILEENKIHMTSIKNNLTIITNSFINNASNFIDFHYSLIICHCQHVYISRQAFYSLQKFVLSLTIGNSWKLF